MKYIFWFTATAILSFSTCIHGKEYCPVLARPQEINVKEMMGTWYAVRGIEHNSTETANTTKRTKSCPLINLTLNGENIEFRWQSKDKPERKFELQINAENAGLWEYKPSKKVKATSAPFRSLQVTIPTENADTWGATMCKSEGRVASVVLSRQPKFSKKNAQKITKVLAAQGLRTDSIFDRCIN